MDSFVDLRYCVISSNHILMTDSIIIKIQTFASTSAYSPSVKQKTFSIIKEYKCPIFANLRWKVILLNSQICTAACILKRQSKKGEYKNDDKSDVALLTAADHCRGRDITRNLSIRMNRMRTISIHSRWKLICSIFFFLFLRRERERESGKNT